jgi:hypothetical protein
VRVTCLPESLAFDADTAYALYPCGTEERFVIEPDERGDDTCDRLASRPCTRCGQPTGNAPEPFFFDSADATAATWQTVCDPCQAPRPVPSDYAQPFADDDEA